MTGERATVLVVDDEPDLVELYADYLRPEYEPVTATSGNEALEELDEAVDIVLLDRRMPDLRGREVLERIRERGLRCRVALVTALDPEFDILDMGLDTYLCKPVSGHELRETVSVLLDRNEYDDRVREYFSLLSKRAVLQREYPEAHLETSDEYADLQSRIEAAGAEIEELYATFDEEDYLVALRDITDDAPHDHDRTNT